MTTTTVASQERDVPSDRETFAALVAILGAIVLGATVIWMVNRAHLVQQELAKSALARGIGVTSTSTSAAGLAGGREAGVVDGISVSGPELLVVGESGEFTVDTGVQNPTWDVTGLTAYSRRNASPHKFELTPNETSAGGEVIVRSGDKVAKKAFKVNPAPKPPAFVLQLATRSWGLIVVAIAVVFGAVALGLTGRLDGGNFVALVAPLAALLGVTSIGGGRNDQTGGN